MYFVLGAILILLIQNRSQSKVKVKEACSMKRTKKRREQSQAPECSDSLGTEVVL